MIGKKHFLVSVEYKKNSKKFRLFIQFNNQFIDALRSLTKYFS